jgi:hypothetical protein
MACPSAAPKRGRLSCSVRTLLILVILTCAYLSCWGPTKNRGGGDVFDWIAHNPVYSKTPSKDELLAIIASPQIPLLVCCVITDIDDGRRSRKYYNRGYEQLEAALACVNGVRARCEANWNR